MASRQEFLRELDTQYASLKDWFDQTVIEEDNKQKDILDLRAKRQELIGSEAARIIPDLSAATLEDRNRITDNKRGLQKEIDQLGFTEDTYKERKGKLEKDLAQRQEANKNYQSVVDNLLLNTRGLAGLLDRGYGTPDYPERWYHRQFYRDWKLADEIVQQLNMESWNKVLERIEEYRNNLKVSAEQVATLNERLKALESFKAQLDELKNQLNSVESNTLNSLRAKVKSQIDSGQHELPGIQELDQKSSQLELELSKIRDQKEKVHDKMVRVQELRVKAANSKREIPDEYIARVRADNSRAPQVVYVHHNDDWFSNYLYYQTMLNIFDPPRHYAQSQPLYSPTQSGGYH